MPKPRNTILVFRDARPPQAVSLPWNCGKSAYPAGSFIKRKRTSVLAAVLADICQADDQAANARA